MARPRLPGRNAPGIEFFWADPDDPEEVHHKLLELSYALDDFKLPLAASSVVLQDSVRTRFATATEPDGRPWDPWSENYEPFARKHTTGRQFADRANLHLTGEMERQVLDPNNWFVTENEVFLDTSSVDDRWAWNNFGAYNRGGGGGTFEYEANDLPPRPFIGSAREYPAGAKIVTLFNQWFQGEVTVATSQKGRKFFRRIPTRRP